MLIHRYDGMTILIQCSRCKVRYWTNRRAMWIIKRIGQWRPNAYCTKCKRLEYKEEVDRARKSR